MSQRKPLTFTSLSGKTIELGEEQSAAYRDVIAGYNVLISGPAGTGKSTLLTMLGAKYGRRMALTASTGIAALNVGGTTINTFAGLGLGTGRAATIAARILEDRGRAYNNITHCRLLAIDEISMISADLFTKTDQVFRMVRKIDTPFGGVQLVLMGDFLQLPPVTRQGEPRAKFAFECEAWVEAAVRVHLLTRVYRQSNQAMIDAFGCLRVGDVHNPLVNVLAARKGAVPPDDGIRPTVIHTHNVDVDRINQQELDKLTGTEVKFHAIDSGRPHAVERLDRDCLAPRELRLKVGAQVMLLANIDINAGLVNGRLGVVTELANGGITVRFGDDDEVDLSRHKWNVMNHTEILATREQYPLKLAYAATTHKCVSPDTLIPTSLGLVRIGDVIERKVPFSVAGIRDYKQVSECYVGHRERAYRITTSRGFSLTCSERHPLYRHTVDGEGWVKAPELFVGDCLRMRRATCAEGKVNLLAGFTRRAAATNSSRYALPEHMTPELAWLLGVLVGDGCCTDRRDGRLDLSTMDASLRLKFTQCVRSVFGLAATTIPKTKAQSRARVTYFHSRGVRDYMAHIGLGYSLAHEKTIPWSVMASPLECQKAFLRGLFDTDGGAGRGAIHFTTASERLGFEAQALLANIGVVAGRAPMGEKYWRVQASGPSAAAYMAAIGFASRLKAARGQRIAKLALRREIPKADKGYFLNGSRIAKEMLGELKQAYGYSYGRGMRMDWGEAQNWGALFSRIASGKSRLNYHHLARMAENFPSWSHAGPVCQRYLGDAEAGAFVDIVAKIERVDSDMRDVCVPDGHAFIGNAFLNHNSQGLTLDRIVCHLGKTFDYGQAYVAVSRVKTLDGLYLRGVTRHHFRAHPKALEFYANAGALAQRPRQADLALAAEGTTMGEAELPGLSLG